MVDLPEREPLRSDAEPGEPPEGVRPSTSSPDPSHGSAPLRSLIADAAMWRFAGAGMELGGSAILVAAIGYAVDRYFENTTLIATALGAVLGFAAGLYRFIRMAMAANRSSGNR